MVHPDRNILLLFTTRTLRLFGYGFLSVILALYLSASGLDDVLMGLLFSLTLVGDAGISLLLIIAAIIGVISPSGNEIGPFLPVEQAMLSQLVTKERRTGLFAWYNLIGSLATACGALAGGFLAKLLQSQGMSPLDSYRMVLLGYYVRPPLGIRIYDVCWTLREPILQRRPYT
jgi:MFS family permease